MAAAWEAARSSVSWQAVKDGWSSKWFQGSKDGSMVALQSDFVGVLGEYLRRHHSGMLALLHCSGSLLHKRTHTEDASSFVLQHWQSRFPSCATSCTSPSSRCRLWRVCCLAVAHVPVCYTVRTCFCSAPCPELTLLKCMCCSQSAGT